MNCIFQSHTKHLLDLIKSTKEEAEEMAEKLKQRATLHAKLVDEFEKNNRNLNRFDCIQIGALENKLTILFVCLEIRTHHGF